MSDLRRIGDLLSLQGAGVLEVDSVGGSHWMRARSAYRLLPPLEPLCWEREPRINVVPLRRAGRYLERVPSSILWARTESGKSATRLRAFKPAPSVVIREGTTVRYVAFWTLEDGLELDWLERANKRIAYWLKTPYKACSIDFQFYLPGTIVRFGRGRPLPVEMVRYEPEVHTAREVVGKLKDPPSDEERREMADRAKARREAART